MIGEKFAKKAIEWLGVPYEHRGTTRNGCDCTGIIIGIARELGFLGKYRLRQYPPDWNLHAGAGNYVVEELLKVADEVPKSGVRPGDIAVMAFGKCAAHAGIIVGGNKFVHALYKAGRCKYGILKNSMWSKRWVMTFRLNEKKMANFS